MNIYSELRALVLLITVPLTQLTSPASAEILHDPTRPQTAAPAAQAAVKAGLRKAAPSLPQLQLVLIAQSRRYVVIDGQLLKTGEFFKGLQITEILPQAVILRTVHGLRTLPLAPLPDK